MKSRKLNSLYEKYDIKNLSYGVKTDCLGDVYEEFICEIFKNVSQVMELLKEECLEKSIIIEFFKKTQINPAEVVAIQASRDVPRRKSGGNSKTDVIVFVELVDNQVIHVPISVKQTSAPKVAFAEYDVDTICSEVGIDDVRVRELMLKHQKDASATNFTSGEKYELAERLKPFAEGLLRWTITMSPIEKPTGDEYPKWILKFQLTKETSKILYWNFYNIEEYIDHIRLDRKGNLKSGGFGTGLSWTYATGSKGRKIQFKG